MKRTLTLLAFLMLVMQSFAQLNVTYTINTSVDRHAISPYIYGLNNGSYRHAAFRRWGGNRLSAYNWENNYSNAGADYINSNDNYLPYILNLASGDYLKPGACIKSFHDTSLAQGAQSAITLPMVGYVSNDGNGTIDPTTELAPSPRWDLVVDVKPTPVSLTPDTTDHTIYVNEELNYITNTFGAASTSTGVQNFIMDNEPGLWVTQFPDMRNNAITYGELFSKSVNLASTVKTADPTANVLGPELYGFTDYYDLQFATDAGDYTGGNWLVDYYLKAMKHASDSEGKRLLDVFTVHWYTAVGNVGDADDTSMATSVARMQSTRTLWDSSYVENSWITSSGFGSYLPIVPRIQNSIDTYYPDTKIGITEYDYGGHGHISGGIAQVDAMGIFGNLNMAYASIWPEVTGSLVPAFDIYRDYDGLGGTYGSTHISAKSNDTLSTIYSSVSDTGNNTLHAIVTNKSYTQSINATINIASDVDYATVNAYYFTGNDTTIHHTALLSSAVTGNVLTYTIPPLSVYHFVLKSAPTSVTNVNSNSITSLSVSPNPAKEIANIAYTLAINTKATMTITNEAGSVVRTYSNLTGNGKQAVSGLKAGAYIAHLTDGASEKTAKFIVTE